MDTFTKRLEAAMKARNMGVSALDHALGKKDGYISNLISRESIPREANLRALAAVLAVNVPWLQEENGERDDEDMLSFPPEHRLERHKEREATRVLAMFKNAPRSPHEAAARFFGLRNAPRVPDPSEECAKIVWTAAQSHPALKSTHEEAKLAAELLSIFWNDLKGEQKILHGAALKLLKAARRACEVEENITRSNVLKFFLSGSENASDHLYLQAFVQGDLLLVQPSHRPASPTERGAGASAMDRVASELNEQLQALHYDDTPEKCVFILMQAAKRLHAQVEVVEETGGVGDTFVIRPAQEL